MQSATNIEQLKARLLLPGIAFLISVASFAVGYRIPKSLPPTTAAAATVQKPDAARVSPARVPVAANTHDALQRDGLKVEGFAKIGFAETEELLTSASPAQREQWARELGALPDQPLKPIAWIGFYTAWLDLEPEGAIRSLRQFPDLMNRLSVFSALAPAIPPTVLPQLIEVISELSSVERRALLPETLAALGQTDPAAAARFIDSHPKLIDSDSAADLVSTWAADDVDAARKWLEASPFSHDPDTVRSLVDSWLAHDPAAAKDYVLLHRQDDGITNAASSVASHLLKGSPDQAREFIRSFDDQRVTEILLSLGSSVEDNQLGNMAALASTLPGPVGEYALAGTLVRWNTVDPGQALAWLRTKPAGERDSILIRMIQTGARSPSPDLLSLVYDIRDTQKRDETLSVLVRSFTGEKEKVAEQIRAIGLSASQTDHLLKLRAALDNNVETTGDH